MSDLRIGANNFFERGLDEILYASAEGTTGLPKGGELPPAELRSQMLDQILHLPSMETFLDEASLPEIEDRELLAASNFRHALDGLLSDLRNLAETMQSGDPEGAKVLNRASRVLSEDAGLRDLVHMYRSTLYQG